MSRHVLVVTNSAFDSPAIPTLPGVDADRVAVVQTLSDPRYGVTDKPVREAHNYTKGALLDTIGGLLQSLEPDDQFLMYFAGHGAPIASSEFGFYCRDTVPDALSLTALTYGSVLRLMGQWGRGRGIVVFDTCHSEAAVAGGAGRRSTAGDTASAVPVDVGEGMVLVWSAMSREDAYERPDGGVFTGALLDSIRTGAGVPLDQKFVWPVEAVEYVRRGYRQSGRVSSWPGCRASGDVSSLYLSVNPRYDGRRESTERARTPAGNWIAAHTTNLSTGSEAIARLRRLAADVSSAAVHPAERRPPSWPENIYRSVDEKEWICVTTLSKDDVIGCSIFNATSAMLLSAAAISACLSWWAFGCLCLGIACIASHFRYRYLMRTLFQHRLRNFLLFTRDGLLHYSNGVIEAFLWNNYIDLSVVRMHHNSHIKIQFADNVSFTVKWNEFEPPLWGNRSSVVKGVEWARHYYDKILEEEVVGPADGWFNRAALAVGVSSYQSLPALRSSQADARSFAKLFESTTNSVAVLESPPTRDEFTRALVLQTRDAASLLLFFSGHGIAVGPELYLAFGRTDPARLEESGFPVSAFRHFLAERRLTRLTIVLDCCYSGVGGLAVGVDATCWAPTLTAITAGEHDIAIIASSGHTQESYANGQSSFFTQAIVRNTYAALAAGKRATVGEVFLGLAEEVRQAAKRLWSESTTTIVRCRRGNADGVGRTF